MPGVCETWMIWALPVEPMVEERNFSSKMHTASEISGEVECSLPETLQVTKNRKDFSSSKTQSRKGLGRGNIHDQLWSWKYSSQAEQSVWYCWTFSSCSFIPNQVPKRFLTFCPFWRIALSFCPFAEAREFTQTRESGLWYQPAAALCFLSYCGLQTSLPLQPPSLLSAFTLLSVLLVLQVAHISPPSCCSPDRLMANIFPLSAKSWPWLPLLPSATTSLWNLTFFPTLCWVWCCLKSPAVWRISLPMTLCAILGQFYPGLLRQSGIFFVTFASSFTFLPMQCEMLSQPGRSFPCTSPWLLPADLFSSPWNSYAITCLCSGEASLPPCFAFSIDLLIFSLVALSSAVLLGERFLLKLRFAAEMFKTCWLCV